MQNEIIIFENQKVKLEVNVKDETVWLNTNQIAKLFDKDESNIRRHIINIFNEGELEREDNVQKIHVDNVKQTVPFYSLDVIISVGYRVKSKEGVAFRKWANQILKDYMIKGYTVNQKRLDYLEKTVKLIEIANRADERLTGEDAKDVIKVIGEYTKSLNLLDDYDHRKINKIKGTLDNRVVKYKDCLEVIKKLRFSDESTIFGVERQHGLESIINDIYLTFDGKDVYSSIEEKACNFLYTLVKNHPFIDGNKRIAATLFIYFLNYYDLLYKDNKQVIDNNTLAAMTLLIAESNPKEKEILIDLTMNFLHSD